MQIKKTVVLYDGACNFCEKWVKYMRQLTGNAVTFIPYQEGCKFFPQVTETECVKAVKVIDENHQVYSGMEAVYWLLYQSGKKKWLYKWYSKNKYFRKLSEVIYVWVSKCR